MQGSSLAPTYEACILPILTQTLAAHIEVIFLAQPCPCEPMQQGQEPWPDSLQRLQQSCWAAILLSEVPRGKSLLELVQLATLSRLPLERERFTCREHWQAGLWPDSRMRTCLGIAASYGQEAFVGLRVGPDSAC